MRRLLQATEGKVFALQHEPPYREHPNPGIPRAAVAACPQVPTLDVPSEAKPWMKSSTRCEEWRPHPRVRPPTMNHGLNRMMPLNFWLRTREQGTLSHTPDYLTYLSMPSPSRFGR